MTGETPDFGDLTMGEFLMRNPDYKTAAVAVRFPQEVGAHGLRTVIEYMRALGATVHPFPGFMPAESEAPEAATSQELAQPLTLTQIQLEQHAKKYFPEGNSEAGKIWRSLENFAAVIRDAKKAAEKAKTSPPQPYGLIRLGMRNQGFSLKNVQIFAQLSFRFVKDNSGMKVMDVYSLYDTLEQLKTLAKRDRGRLPIMLPQLREGRVGFLLYLVNSLLKPEEPLSYEGIRLRRQY